MNLTSLLSKTQDELGALGKQYISKSAGACMTLGKIIFALQGKLPQGEAMSKFILSTLGATRADVPSVAWSVARCAEYIGEGADRFAETDMDKTPARWLGVASPVYSVLAKAESEEKIDAAKAAGYRAQVAGVIRERPANGMEILQALRDALKGKPEPKIAGAGGNTADAGEPGEETTPEEKALAAMKEAARLLADSAPDSEACKVFRRLALGIARIARLKAKTAPAAPVAPLAVEGVTLAPTGMGTGRGKRRAADTAQSVAVTPLAAVLDAATAAAA